MAQTAADQPPAEAEPVYHIGTVTIKFVGMANVNEQIVRANMALREDTDLDESLIDRDIRSLYKTGLFEFIEVKRETIAGHGVNLILEVTPKFRVLAVRYEGNKAYKEKRLQKEIKTVANGALDERQIKDDAQKIYEFYQKNGFNQAQVTFSLDRNRSTGFATVTFKVREGAKVRISTINFIGNDHVKARKLRGEIETKKWNMFSWLTGGGRLKDDEFDTDLEKLRDYFKEEGYLDVEIAEDKISFDYPKPDRLVITIRVNEGRRYKIGDITFTGNLTFGAGFSSLERAVVFAEITQSNFDLFNRRSFFQGDGQKFRLRFQIGSQSSEVVLAFEEPWLFERELALGFQAFRTTSEYNSSYYQEIRTGAEVYLRKRLFNWLEGRLSYVYEVVDIGNVAAEAPFPILAASGKTSTSKVGLSLTQDTRDKMINTTRGNYGSLSLNVAGGPLGGDNNYYQMEFRGSKFFPIAEFQEQVISLIGRVGVTESFGASAKSQTKTINYFDSQGVAQTQSFSYIPDVPFYDRFFLGGPQTLRGFEFRTVGPKDASGEPIGGKTYGFVSLEYSFDVVKPVRFAFFYDGGFANKDAYDFSPAQYNDNVGLGLRLFVAGAPLSLDFGVPLTSDKFNKKGTQFNFSFGTRF